MHSGILIRVMKGAPSYTQNEAAWYLSTLALLFLVVAQVGHSKSSILPQNWCVIIQVPDSKPKSSDSPWPYTHIDHIPFQVLKYRYMPSAIREANPLDLRIDINFITPMSKGEVLIRKKSLKTTYH